MPINFKLSVEDPLQKQTPHASPQIFWQERGMEYQKNRLSSNADMSFAVFVIRVQINANDLLSVTLNSTTHRLLRATRGGAVG
jgi:hypothetical protein